MEKTFSGFIGNSIIATKIDGYNLYYWEDGSTKYIGTPSGLTFKGVDVLEVLQHTYGCLTEETKEEFINGSLMFMSEYKEN